MSAPSSSRLSAQAEPNRPFAGRHRRDTSRDQTPPTASAPRSQRRQNRGVMPPEAPKKVKRDPFHLKKADIPEDVKNFKTALEIHIRILIGSYSTTAIPEPPSIHDIRSFEQRFTNAEDVERLLRNTARTYVIVNDQVTKLLKELRAGCATQHASTTSQIISQIPENILRIMFSTVHEFGLSAWRPDLLSGTPTSLYHGALESIAIWTFEQALTSFGYVSLQPNISYIRNTVLVKKLYMNFVWSYLKNLVLKEHKVPGSVRQAVDGNKAYKFRLELNEKRRRFFVDTGFPERVQLLCSEPECASDHEATPRCFTFSAAIT